MIVFLIIYLTLVIFTWIYAGYASGLELSEVKAKMDKAGAPPQYVQINYTNVFYQGLAWPSYWSVLAGQKVFKSKQSGLNPATTPPRRQG